MSKTARQVADRSLLRFADEVTDRFAFLDAQGLRRVHVEDTLVRFESHRLTINIYHGRQSYEIGLEVEGPASPHDRYSFSELLRLVDQEQAQHYRCFAAHNIQGVSNGVRQLAETFQKYFTSGILDDNRLFSRLKQQRETLNRDYAKDVELQQARRKADDAWHQKDYSLVVKNLKPLRDSLSPSEVAKLAFAEKHL